VNNLRCEDLPGRLRDICRGHDEQGVPVLTLEKCNKYRDFFINGQFKADHSGAAAVFKERAVGKKVASVSKAEQGRALWKELFLAVETEFQLQNWEQKIPKYGCSCSSFYTKWKSNHIPSFPLSFEWKHSLKSAVNQKLGHPDLALEEARAFWNSQSGT
jgi:hypothetical protein